MLLSISILGAIAIAEGFLIVALLNRLLVASKITPISILPERVEERVEAVEVKRVPRMSIQVPR